MQGLDRILSPPLMPVKQYSDNNGNDHHVSREDGDIQLGCFVKERSQFKRQPTSAGPPTGDSPRGSFVASDGDGKRRRQEAARRHRQLMA